MERTPSIIELTGETLLVQGPKYHSLACATVNVGSWPSKAWCVGMGIMSNNIVRPDSNM
jgi:hypothetical protein